jgi:RNA polymerase sigma factor (TIGR02999 family)
VEHDVQHTTRLLERVAAGDSPSASASLMAQVYEELRGLAGGYLRREKAAHTLQPTALVHEAFLKLVDQTSVQWNGRAHFFAVAAKAMRQVLVDHARAKNADKRGGGWGRVTLDQAVWPAGVAGGAGGGGGGGTEVDVLALNEVLDMLAEIDPRQAQVVELRFFGGLTVDEVATVVGISKTTAEEEWRMARAWLSRRLGPDAGGKER